MKLPSGRVVTCAIYRHPVSGFDLRAVFTEDDVLQSHAMGRIDAARRPAVAWKMAVMESGGIEIRLNAEQVPG
jgi:hypothetical protein